MKTDWAVEVHLHAFSLHRAGWNNGKALDSYLGISAGTSDILKNCRGFSVPLGQFWDSISIRPL
jgi:hypothetical protein